MNTTVIPSKRNQQRIYRSTPGIVLAASLALSQPANREAAVASPIVRSGENGPPNILFIYVDDVGWNHLSSYGQTLFDTPNMDRLAEEGMLFTDAYSPAAVCSPSRSSLLSGMYMHRHQHYLGSNPHTWLTNMEEIRDWRAKMWPPPFNARLPEEFKTFGHPLQDAGYTTGFMGKWHLGALYTEDVLWHHPEERGFDEGIMHKMAGPYVKSPQERYFWPEFSLIPEQYVEDGTYHGDLLTDQAIDFLERHKDAEDPFFLMVSYFLVHAPLQAHADTVQEVMDANPTLSEDHATYVAMFRHLDDGVGRILDTLDEEGLTDNTVVFFSSDNGGYGIHEFGGNNFGGNFPLRGHKHTYWEGGIRVPMMVRWPGVVTPGTVTDKPVHQIDYMPTFLEIAQADPIPDQIMDGISLVDHLASDGAVRVGRENLFWHFPGYTQSRSGRSYGGYPLQRPVSIVRSGDFKLLEWLEDGEVELYNLHIDKGEIHDLAAVLPETVDELRQILHTWRAEENVHMPTEREPEEPEPVETIMEQSGDPRESGNWSDDVPAVDHPGIVPSGITATLNENDTVTFSADLTIEGVFEQAGDGTLIFGANSSVRMESGGWLGTAANHLRFNRASLTVNGGTVASGGNIDLYGTGGQALTLNSGSVTAEGNMVMNPNLDADPDAYRHLLVRSGSLTADHLNLSERAYVFFDAASGHVSVDGVNLSGDAYIDFVGDTLGTLTVAGFSTVDFEGLYMDGRLLVNGANDGDFADYFNVSDSTLSRAHDESLNIMTQSGDPLDEANWSVAVPTVDVPGTIPVGVTGTFDESENIQFPAVLTVNGTLEQVGAGALIFQANSSVTVGESGLIETTSSSAHFRINRGPLLVSGGTVSSAGNVDLFGTGVFELTLQGGTVSADGNLVMNPNVGADPDSYRTIRIFDGVMEGNELRLFENSSLYFDGPGGSAGSVSVNSLLMESNAYINFVGETYGTLSVAGYSAANFEAMYDAGQLRYNGQHAGEFSDHFEVANSTVMRRTDAAQTYEAWADEQGIPEDQRGWDDDPFGTGVTNLEAYLTGVSQQEPVRGPLEIHQDAGRPILTIPWRTNIAVDSYFAVETSEDLRDWEDGDLDWESEPLDYGRVEYRGEPGDDSLSGTQFYRAFFGVTE